MKESKVKLIKAKPKGYFLEVSDGLTEYSWAITKFELLLIWEAVKDEIERVFRNNNTN